MLSLRRSALSLSIGPAWSDSKIERKIGNILKPLAVDHDLQRLSGIAMAQILHCGHELRKSKMIHAVNVPGAQRDGGQSARQRFASHDGHVRQPALPVADQIERLGA